MTPTPLQERPTGRYGAKFQDLILDGSLVSARKVVPTLIALTQPASVVDVGCGTGAWLSVFRENGVSDVVGVDGDYVPRASLLIPAANFLARDVAAPLRLGRRFGLAISLEVAEHVRPVHADRFVRTLCELSDVVAFSAAIPNQGGEGHVNEQWPSYWKAKFEARGYLVVDCLRRRFWTDADIEKWYRQNLLLYVRRERLAQDPVLAAERAASEHQILDIVHPESFFPMSLRQLVHSFPKSLRRAIRKRL